MNVLISIAAFVVAISVLIAVHEWGHYLVARALGIKVLRFSIGFGRPLWSRRSGPDKTEYVIAQIPLGGYVKLLDEREAPVDPSERHRAFNRQPIPNRMAVLVAGPAFNFFFAVIAYAAMFMAGIPGMRAIIGSVEPDSHAAQADIRVGDQIVAVAGRDTPTWETAVLAIVDDMLADGQIDLEVVDDEGVRRSATLDVRGEESALTEPGALLQGLGMRPFTPVIPALLAEVSDNGPAERAGFVAGDRIIAADGVAIEHWTGWAEYVRERPGETILVTVERGGEEFELDVVIGEIETDGRIIGRFGAAAEYPRETIERVYTVQRFGPIAATGAAVARTWDMTTLTLRMLWKMVLGDVSVRNLSGPINIAQYAGQAARFGLAPFLSFLAVVSISLGIINLLPVPMLDGGQLVYQMAELVKGSPVSERAQILGQQVGIVALILIMSLAIYNDIARLME